ncbi:hypothetical protein JM16_006116 [Phytophthora kernoviae]|uniref:W2 domain-containing protein n=1 Tax=Phytophthora kernoviae TaxID=325452 RepID=A0A8T0LUL0_9STRA|nr:hypothetical protein JM16_006116 [Phytophthora kernoviae]
MVRGKKIGLGEFLGDQAASYIPEAALPSGPRARADDDDGNYRGDRRGGDRFGDRGGDRFGDREPSRSDQSDQWRGDRGGRGGDRFGGDRGGDRFGGDRGGDRFSGDLGGDRGGDRFGRDEVNDRQQAPAPQEPQMSDKKLRAQQKREERKKKAEEERLVAEEAKRVAAEEKKQAEEVAAKKAEADRETMKKVLASGKKGEELVAVAKDLFGKQGSPSGSVLFETVTNAAEDVAKSSANWIALPAYGELLKFGMEKSDKKDQMEALYALQVFLNKYEFPKGVMEKCFMALYSLDIIEDVGFFEYKYDVDGDVPGRMKAIIQTSSWLTWLETPEEESEEEDDE